MQKTNDGSIFQIISILVTCLGLLCSIYTLNHNIATTSDILNYRIDQLEVLNHPSSNIERAQFKQLEKCVLSEYSMYENSKTGKFLIDFDENKAKNAFNLVVNQCLNQMVQESTYQTNVLNNLDSVKSSFDKLRNFELR